MSKKWPIFAYDTTDRLREKRTRGGEGVQNPENFAYVLNGCSLTGSPIPFADYFAEFPSEFPTTATIMGPPSGGRCRRRDVDPRFNVMSS